MDLTRVHLTQHCRHTTTMSEKETERYKEGRERGTVTEKDVGEEKRNKERADDVLLKVASSLPTCPHFK